MNQPAGRSLNLVLSRPIATDDSMKQSKREHQLYNSARMRHKRIFSMGEYDTHHPIYTAQSEAVESLYKQSAYK